MTAALIKMQALGLEHSDRSTFLFCDCSIRVCNFGWILHKDSNITEALMHAIRLSILCGTHNSIKLDVSTQIMCPNYVQISHGYSYPSDSGGGGMVTTIWEH